MKGFKELHNNIPEFFQTQGSIFILSNKDETKFFKFRNIVGGNVSFISLWENIT